MNLSYSRKGNHSLRPLLLCVSSSWPKLSGCRCTLYLVGHSPAPTTLKACIITQFEWHTLFLWPLSSKKPHNFHKSISLESGWQYSNHANQRVDLYVSTTVSLYSQLLCYQDIYLCCLRRLALLGNYTENKTQLLETYSEQEMCPQYISNIFQIRTLNNFDHIVSSYSCHH